MLLSELKNDRVSIGEMHLGQLLTVCSVDLQNNIHLCRFKNETEIFFKYDLEFNILYLDSIVHSFYINLNLTLHDILTIISNFFNYNIIKCVIDEIN